MSTLMEDDIKRWTAKRKAALGIENYSGKNHAGDSLQEFITPYSPKQIGMVERVIRVLKEQCVHRQLATRQPNHC